MELGNVAMNYKVLKGFPFQLVPEDRPTFSEIRKYFAQYQKQIEDKAKWESEERSLLETRRKAVTFMENSEQDSHVYVSIHDSIYNNHLVRGKGVL